MLYTDCKILFQALDPESQPWTFPVSWGLQPPRAPPISCALPSYLTSLSPSGWSHFFSVSPLSSPLLLPRSVDFSPVNRLVIPKCVCLSHPPTVPLTSLLGKAVSGLQSEEPRWAEEEWALGLERCLNMRQRVQAHAACAGLTPSWGVSRP